MRKVSLILVTAPIAESQIKAQLAKLRKLGLKIHLIGVPNAHGQKRHSLLTPCQTVVLREIASGLRTIEIAHKLDVSIKTIETHRAHMMKRLGIRSIPRLVRYALRKGVLPASWLLD